MKSLDKVKTLLKAILVIVVVLAFFLPTSAISNKTAIDKKTQITTMTPIEEPLPIGGPVVLNARQLPFKVVNRDGFGSLGTDIQVTDHPEYDGNPGLAIDDENTMAVMYEYGASALEQDIYVATSIDGGQAWEGQVGIDVDGNIEKYPAIDYAGVINGKRAFYGTFLSEANDGGDTYLLEIPDILDTANWVLWSAPFSGNGFHDFSSCDIVADNKLIGQGTGYHFVAYIASFDNIPGYPNCIQVPLYLITSGDSFWIFWFYYNNSANVKVDLDKSKEYVYLTFECQNGTNQDVILLSSEYQYVGRTEGDGGWGDGHGEGRKFQVRGPANTTNPVIAAEGGYVYLITQTDIAGNQDIVCYYSQDNGGNYSMNVIANTSADEVYPAIYAYGKIAICTFMKNNSLYSAITQDGGITWAIQPTAINDIDGKITTQYHGADIYGGRFGADAVWTDNRSGNNDVYFDEVLHIEYPHIVIKNITGGLKGVTATITNDGEAAAHNVTWQLKVTGGILDRINKNITDKALALNVNDDILANTKMIVGLGTIIIAVTVTCDEGVTDSKTADGTQLFFFTIVK